MSDATHSMTTDQLHLNTLDKLAAWFSWCLAGVVFFCIGWMVMAPDDPLGALSLLARHNPLSMLFQSCFLACVIAALTTLIAGKKRSDIGTMTAAIGLAIVSFRGETMSFMLVRESESGSSSLTGLAMLLSLESLAWFAVIILTFWVSGWIMHRRYSIQPHDETHAQDALHWMSMFDIPRFGLLLSEGKKSHRTPPAVGLKHTAMVAIVGLVTFTILTSGSSSRSIQHGQACFVVAASVFIACYFTYRSFPVFSSLWSVLGVGLMALIGYLISIVYTSDAHTAVSIPASPFLRVLPIQFISVGTITAIFMFWSMQYHILLLMQRPATKKSKSTGRSETVGRAHTRKG